MPLLQRLVNKPGDMEAIEDNASDAQKSEDPSGVRMALVARAESALQAGGMARAEGER